MTEVQSVRFAMMSSGPNSSIRFDLLPDGNVVAFRIDAMSNERGYSRISVGSNREISLEAIAALGVDWDNFTAGDGLDWEAKQNWLKKNGFSIG